MSDLAIALLVILIVAKAVCFTLAGWSWIELQYRQEARRIARNGSRDG